jgi:hypothetical protein
LSRFAFLSVVCFAPLVPLLTACGYSVQRQPAGAPPTPASITKAHPGGDAEDEHEAALKRQLTEPWRFGEDKDHQLRIPLVDAPNYKRVRYSLVDHFVGFKYGQDFHTANVVFMMDVPKGEPIDAKACLLRAENWGFPLLKSFAVTMGEMHVKEGTWHDKNIYVKTVDGYFDMGLQRRKFSAAYAAYPAYPDACMVFGFAVPWRDHDQLAKQVRDRWVAEGVSQIEPLTETRPYRK